jgi:hypothetical protein
LHIPLRPIRRSARIRSLIPAWAGFDPNHIYERALPVSSTTM